MIKTHFGPGIRLFVIMLMYASMEVSSVLAQTQSLSSLTNYTVPGLEEIQVNGVVGGDGYFYGKVPGVLAGGVDTTLAPTVVGFGTPGADFNVVIIFNSFRLSDYVSSFDIYPIKNLVFNAPRLTIVPAGNEGSGVAVPDAVQNVLSEGLTETITTLDLVAGNTIGATAMLDGELKTWLGSGGLGLPIDAGLPLGGTIPPGLFSRQVDAATLRPLIDLSLTIDPPNQPWLSAATFTRKLNLNVTGSSTGWDVGMATGLKFSLGPASVAFDSVRVERAGETTTVSAFASPDAPFTVASLMGADIPGLSALNVEAITLGDDYIQGAISLGSSGRNWQVVLAHPTDLGTNLFALWPEPDADGNDDLRLSDVINAGGVLDELSLAKPTLIYATPDQAQTVNLPAPLSDRLGAIRTLESGIALDAIPTVNEGNIKTLLSAVGVAADSLFKLSGTMDPFALSRGRAPAPNIALTIPLPDILPDESTMSFAGNSVAITRKDSVATIGVTTTLSLTGIENGPPSILTTITTGRDDKGDFTEIAGSLDPAVVWENAFGLSSLDLTGLSVDVRLGTGRRVALDADTNLGRSDIDSLRASLVWDEGLSTWTIGLKEADFPIAALMPSGVDLKIDGKEVMLRDVALSTGGAGLAIAGTGWTDPAQKLDLVVFQSPRGWNLAIKQASLTLADFVGGGSPGNAAGDTTLAAVAGAILGQVKLEPAATVVSLNGLTADPNDLSPVAVDALSKIVGSESLRIKQPGIGLIGQFNPHSLGPQFATALQQMEVADEPMTMSGSLGVGLLGLAAGFSLPETAMINAALDSLGVKNDPETSFFVEVGTAGTSFGVALDSLGLHLRSKPKGKPEQPGPVIENLSLALGELGVSIGTKIDLVKPWENALGISGFTMETGSLTLALDATAGGAIQINDATTTIPGLQVDGEVEVQFGVLTALAAGGQIDKLGMDDILTLTTKQIEATLEDSAGTAFMDAIPSSILGPGQDQSPEAISNAFLNVATAALPPARVEGVEIGFATPKLPGATVPSDSLLRTYNLYDENLGQLGLGQPGGIRLAGTLYLFSDTQDWGSIDATVSPTGMRAIGSLDSIKIGTVIIKRCSLDVATVITGPPHFRFGGEIDDEGNGVFAKKTAVHLGLSPEEISLDIAGDANLGTGNDFEYTFGAFIELPQPTATLELLAGADMGLRAGIVTTDLQNWLKEDGPNTVKGAVNTVDTVVDSLNKALADLNYVDSLKVVQIDSARAVVRADQAAAKDRIQDIQNHIAQLQSQLEVLRSQLGDIQLEACNQTKRVCSSYGFSFSRGVYCKARKHVADWPARARCAARNTVKRAQAASKQVEIDIAEAALEGAQDALEFAQNQNLPVDLDPRVAPLIVEEQSIKLSVDATQTLVNGASGATAFVSQIVDLYEEVAESVDIDSAGVEGSLQQAMKGEGALLTLAYTVHQGGYSVPLVTSIPVYFNDPARTANKVELVALRLGSQAVTVARANGQPVPGPVEQLIQNQYAAKHIAMTDSVSTIQQAAGVVPEPIVEDDPPIVDNGQGGLLAARLDSAFAKDREQSNQGLRQRSRNFRNRIDGHRRQLDKQLVQVVIDNSAQQWRLRETQKAEIDSTGPTFSGSVSADGSSAPTSIALQANGKWNYEINTKTPLEVEGLGSFRMAIFTKDIEIGDGFELDVRVRADGGGSSGWVDVSNQVTPGGNDWQVITFNLDEGTTSVDRIKLRGTCHGQFYTDGFAFDISRMTAAGVDVFEDDSCDTPVDPNQTVLYGEGCETAPSISGNATSDPNHSGRANSGTNSQQVSADGPFEVQYDNSNSAGAGKKALQVLRPIGLRFAIHPGTLEKENVRALTISLGEAEQVSSKQTELPESLDHNVPDLLNRFGLDLARKAWQTISIPIVGADELDVNDLGSALQLSGLLDHVAIRGHLTGTFYIDDVVLLFPLTPLGPSIPASPSSLAGDFDDDREVGFKDFILFAGAFGSDAAGEFAKFDLTDDGEINFADFLIFGQQFGKTE